MPASTVPPLWLRMRFSSAALPRAQLGQPGILCVAMRTAATAADILVWDEDGNDGASSTNVMESVLEEAERAWHVDVQQSRIVERDSVGHYDEVIPEVLPCGRRRIRWRALVHEGCEARSAQAFAARFPDLARAVVTIQAALPKG